MDLLSRLEHEPAPPDPLPHLKWALQALALPAESQLRLFPDFVCKADELALDFDDAERLVRGASECRLSPRQSTAIDDLDDALDSMSGENNAAHWTEAALREDPFWRAVRELAGRALDAFGWPHEEPPPGRATYVRGG